MPLSYKDIAEIVKLVDASNLDAIAIELPDIKLVVRRHGAGESPDAAPISLPSPSAAVPEPAPRAALASLARADGAIEIRAPMVGTFHRSPSPEDPPFVEIGAHVKSGKPLGLIQVMNLHTTIEAKHAGRIAEIPAVSDALVEYDQVLFVIAPV